jgi:hypothetical protein
MDATLRRVERTALVACGGMAVIALVAGGGRLAPALGVLGGGVLIAVSYLTVKGGVGALTDALAPPQAARSERARRRRIVRLALGAAGRYALLALLAYVMIARLRLHPLGLLAGASSVVAAVSVEAIRLLLKKS